MSLLRACGRVLYGSLLSPLPTGFLRPGAASLGATRLMKASDQLHTRPEFHWTSLYPPPAHRFLAGGFGDSEALRELLHHQVRPPSPGSPIVHY